MDCSLPEQPRTLWSILWLCALTLLICVWHAIHPDVPPYPKRWYHLLRASPVKSLFVAILSFLLPEWTVYSASGQWCVARDKVKKFTEEGYDWSMMHSQFAEMGGFVYRYGENSYRRIDSLEFLRLCKEKKIANPEISELEIKDKSKSDGLGKTILAIQLIWFTSQVAVRIFRYHYSATLVELDTACMAVLTILLLVFWHNKPLRPQRPHIFYSRRYLEKVAESSNVHDEEGTSSDDAPSPAPLRKRLNDAIKVDNFALNVLCATWIIFGGLHLSAWNYGFRTPLEMTIWRAASFFLTVSPLAVLFGKLTSSILRYCCFDLFVNIIERIVLFAALTVALACRFVLLVLMLASLRALPCTTYDVVAWTAYVPHF